MGEIAVNQNPTIVLPVPLDLFTPFLQGQDGSGQGTTPTAAWPDEQEAGRLYEEAVGDATREVSSEAAPTEMPNGEAGR